MKPHYKANNVAELLGVVPTLLGFRPADSLVAIVLDGKQVALSARLDFPSDAACAEAVAILRGVWPQGASGFIIAYTGQDPWRVLARCERAFPAATVIHVDGRQWRECCPNGPLGSFSEANLGVPILRSRDELRASLDSKPTPEFGVELQRVAKLSAAERVGLTTALAASHDADSAVGCAQAAVLAAFADCRAALTESLTCQSAPEQLEFWRAAVRCAPAEHQLHPLSVLGLVSWLCGNGTLQLLCVERAAQILDLRMGDLVGAPGHLDPRIPPLVSVLALINAKAVPPTQWERLRLKAVA
ncbi:MAG: DUF4192 domain-containing protein [Propionibacteriaceae bacterium]|jgi:hypothetical protein|nr:DUF4192 domain-containing protein [Propionibacteriaceae bacterium]